MRTADFRSLRGGALAAPARGARTNAGMSGARDQTRNGWRARSTGRAGISAKGAVGSRSMCSIGVGQGIAARSARRCTGSKFGVLTHPELQKELQRQYGGLLNRCTDSAFQFFFTAYLFLCPSILPPTNGHDRARPYSEIAPIRLGENRGAASKSKPRGGTPPTPPPPLRSWGVGQDGTENSERFDLIAKTPDPGLGLGVGARARRITPTRAARGWGSFRRRRRRRDGATSEGSRTRRGIDTEAACREGRVEGACARNRRGRAHAATTRAGI